MYSNLLRAATMNPKFYKKRLLTLYSLFRLYRANKRQGRGGRGGGGSGGGGRGRRRGAKEGGEQEEGGKEE
jgi:hypothetical protein